MEQRLHIKKTQILTVQKVLGMFSHTLNKVHIIHEYSKINILLNISVDGQSI